MSLFLRKACQENLDGVGLQNYHIQVDEGTKCLQIVGECGDVFVSITGIRLSRMAPADKEIDLAIELFDDFLAKHTGTFKAFLDAKIRADKSKIPLEVKGLLDAEVTKPNWQDYWNLKFSMKAAPDQTIEVQSNGSVKIPQFQFDMVDDPKVNIQPVLTPREVLSVQKWILACTEYHEATKEKTRLLEVLSTCEI